MSNTLLSTVTATLLAAACLTALADPPRKHNRVSDVSEPTAYQPSASADEADDTGDGTPEYIQAGARSGSHSMHPTAPVAAQPLTDDEAELPQQVVDE